MSNLTRTEDRPTTTSRSLGLQDWGPVVLRVAIGVVFVMHGGQKLLVYGIPGVAGSMEQLGLPLPYVSATLATATELLGGLALIIGAGTRHAALGLAVVMVIAAITAHSNGGFFLPDGFEYVLTLGAATAAIFLSGAGQLSVDALLATRKQASR